MIVAWNSCLTGLYLFLSDPELALHQFYPGSGTGVCCTGPSLLVSWALLTLHWLCSGSTLALLVPVSAARSDCARPAWTGPAI
ncbi:hypothetical protein BDV10DRAFT_179627, partial [Aspergillus recurvatus]